jgi:hypothetical protein
MNLPARMAVTGGGAGGAASAAAADCRCVLKSAARAKQNVTSEVFLCTNVL